MSQLQVTGEAKIRDIQGPVVANSGVITALDGAASQYVRGDGTLADFPTSTGGGSSVSYYLNSSVSQGTIGGVAYRELSKEPIIGAGTDIAISANGYVANYLTDANDPDVLSIPGGNFNCEFYFSVNNNTGNPTTYAELYKYDGTTFTLLGTSAGVPESINQGTTIAPYYFAIPVATAALSVTDRLAIRIYVNVSGRTITLHTENGHLCQVVTTLSKGMVSLNNLTDQSQYLATGTSGTDFNIVSSVDTHTFNIPSASATNRGLITTGTQTIAGLKAFDDAITGNSGIAFLNGVMPPITSSYYSGIGGNSQGISIVTRPVATNYTNNLYFPSASNSYTLPDASGTLALTSDIPSITGLVPYTGATANVDLGTFNLTADVITGTTGSFASSGGSDTFAINHSSGSGIALNITKGGNGEGLYINKTSGSGNAATIIGTLNATTLVKSGGTSSQFLMADGSVNTSVLPSGAYLPLTGGTLTGALSGTSATFNTNSTSNAGFFQINDATTTLGNSFATVHRNANDGNGRFSLSRWQVQNTSGLDQSAFIGAQAVTGASNYSPNLILGVSNGASSYTTYLTIASTGAATFSSSVGVGGSPSDTIGYGIALDVQSSSGAALYLRDSSNPTTQYGFIAYDGNDDGLKIQNQNSSGYIRLNTNGTERMRITSGGYFKASVDGTYLTSGAYHELKTNTSNQETVIVTNSSASPYGITVYYTGASPNNTSNWFFNGDANGTLRVRLMSNGGIANYQSNDTNLSDERTKKDIIPLESYWDKFKAIEIVKFKYKDQTHDDFNIGVIAQQVEAVAPEFIDVDGWGETPEDGEPLKSVYTADLHHATIKVLQEAMDKIEQLELKVKQLENK